MQPVSLEDIRPILGGNRMEYLRKTSVFNKTYFLDCWMKVTLQFLGRILPPIRHLWAVSHRPSPS